MTEIDLNCDMGEGYGRWRIGDDKALMPYISSVNVAAGYHAGDPRTMRETITAAAENGLSVGAHVALPDLMGFGRRAMSVAPQDLCDYTLHQVGGLGAFAEAAGVHLSYVKPHGALYAMASSDPEVAGAVAKGISEFDSNLPMLLLNDDQRDAVQRYGIDLICEGFPDLHYDGSGALVLEGEKQPWDPHVVAERAIRMVKEGCVAANDGAEVVTNIRSLCVHGDAPNALEVVMAVRSALDEAGITVKAFAR